MSLNQLVTEPSKYEKYNINIKIRRSKQTLLQCSPLMAPVQTYSTFSQKTFCVCPCDLSYWDYRLYIKLFCQSVLSFFIYQHPRLRCQTSTKHLFKPSSSMLLLPGRCKPWSLLSLGSAIESLFEVGRPLVKVEILVFLNFCCAEHLKHAYGNVNRMSLFVVNNNGKSQRKESAAWEFTVWCWEG